MHALDSDQRARIAKLAYCFYQERVQKGLPGDELQDWQRAEQAAFEEANPANAEEEPAQTSVSLPVTAIKGIGPKVADELALHGVATVAELAGWSLSDFGEKLPRLTARAKSGHWIEQAIDLAGN